MDIRFLVGLGLGMIVANKEARDTITRSGNDLAVTLCKMGKAYVKTNTGWNIPEIIKEMKGEKEE